MAFLLITIKKIQTLCCLFSKSFYISLLYFLHWNRIVSIFMKERLRCWFYDIKVMKLQWIYATGSRSWHSHIVEHIHTWRFSSFIFKFFFLFFLLFSTWTTILGKWLLLFTQLSKNNLSLAWNWQQGSHRETPRQSDFGLCHNLQLAWSVLPEFPTHNSAPTAEDRNIYTEWKLVFQKSSKTLGERSAFILLHVTAGVSFPNHPVISTFGNIT